MRFMGRKTRWDGALEGPFVIEVLEAHVCLNSDNPGTCYYIGAENAVAKYKLRTPGLEVLSTDIAEKFVMALVTENLVRLDDFGLVITDIEYTKYQNKFVTNEWDEEENKDIPLKVVIVKDEAEKSEKQKKQEIIKLIPSIIRDCKEKDSFRAAGKLIEDRERFQYTIREEDRFQKPAEEMGELLEKCVSDFNDVIERYIDADDITPEILGKIYSKAMGLHYLYREGSYFMIGRVAYLLTGEEEWDI